METLLKDHRKDEINADFRVSTVLFPSRFETRIFSETDYLPPALLKRLAENVSEIPFLDSHFVEEGSGERYNDDTEEYEDCITGYAVETYGFTDANTVHDVIVATLRGFVKDYTRVVKYV